MGLLLFMIQHVDVDSAIGSAFDYDKKELGEWCPRWNRVVAAIEAIREISPRACPFLSPLNSNPAPALPPAPDEPCPLHSH